MPALRVWLGVVLLAPAVASAQPAADAARLFDEGRALVEAGDYPDACAKFDASFALDHALGTELNLADCDEHIGRLRAAWDLFTAAASAGEKTGDKRAQFARERLAALEPKLATIVIHIAEPRGLTVTIDGREVPAAAEIRERVDPGKHEIRVTAPDHPELVRSAEAAAGATVVVDVLPFAARPAVAPPAPATYVRRHSRVVTGWYLGGAAALVAGTGIVVGLVGRSQYNGELANGDCVQQPAQLRCNQNGYSTVGSANRLESVATGFGIAAIGLAAASAVVVLTAPRERVQVAPLATPGAAGVTVRGAF